MRPDFELPEQQDFECFSSLPDGYTGTVLHGSNILRAEHPSIGQVILQELNTRDFNIHFNIFNLSRPFRFQGIRQAATLSSFLALKNAIRYHFKYSGSFELNRGQFSLLHSNELHASIEFEKPGLYHSLEVSWTGRMINEVLPLYSFLNTLGSEKDNKRSFHLMPYKNTAGIGSLGPAHAILRFTPGSPIEYALFELKVKEYLLVLLAASGKTPFQGGPIRKQEYIKLTEIANKLEEYPGNKFPLSKLSVQANMNEKKLNRLFNAIFGKPVFEYHLSVRMKEAHRLLEETRLTTQEVASKVGYELTTSFISKFSDYFGYPPSEVSRLRH